MPKRRKPPLLIDRIGDPMEERCKAWLTTQPTPPMDGFDRLCWQAITNYVTMMENIRRYGHVEPPADERGDQPKP